jgi:hypothetical protein
MSERAIGSRLMRLTGDGVWGLPPEWDDAVALVCASSGKIRATD